MMFNYISHKELKYMKSIAQYVNECQIDIRIFQFKRYKIDYQLTLLFLLFKFHINHDITSFSRASFCELKNHLYCYDSI